MIPEPPAQWQAVPRWGEASRMPRFAANRAIKDGSLPKLVQGFLEAAKPEGAWFTAVDGRRTMIAVFDLTSPA